MPQASFWVSCLDSRLSLNYYEEMREFNAHMEKCREKVKKEGNEHVTIKGEFCMHNQKFKIESEGIMSEAFSDFSKKYDAHLNKKYDSLDDQKEV